MNVRPLSELTWLRVGGSPERFAQPADAAELARLLAETPPAMPVFPLGVGSNLIVRDGGLPGLALRLGRGFREIAIDGDIVTAGAAALDARVAIAAAQAGRDLSFLRTIPGTIGGAVRMNAGCYGSYLADVFVEATAVTREGVTVTLGPEDLRFAYRQSVLPEGWVLTQARLRAPSGDPDALAARMAAQLARRDASQPTGVRSAGSTFRNPSGASSTGQPDDTHALKAWALIDAAGFRGARLGGAQISEKHTNFLINAGGARAADLEALGERVRKGVFDHSGVTLEWEIMRIGNPAASDRPEP